MKNAARPHTAWMASGLAALAFMAACSSGWDNPELFHEKGAELEVRMSESGNPDLAGHYFLNVYAAVGGSGFVFSGLLGQLLGKPEGLALGDADGDGDEDLVVVFSRSLHGVGLAPRAHIWLQDRTTAGTSIEDGIPVPPVPVSVAPVDMEWIRGEVTGGRFNVVYRTSRSTADERIAYDLESEAWIKL